MVVPFPLLIFFFLLNDENRKFFILVWLRLAWYIICPKNLKLLFRTSVKNDYKRYMLLWVVTIREDNKSCPFTLVKIVYFLLEETFHWNHGFILLHLYILTSRIIWFLLILSWNVHVPFSCNHVWWGFHVSDLIFTDVLYSPSTKKSCKYWMHFSKVKAPEKRSVAH